MDEFIDAYSDDQIFLTVLDKLIESHPVEGSTPDFIKYSTCCRLYATMMISSIEMMIKKWGGSDPLWHDIGRYLKTGDNKIKTDKLRDAMKMRGLKIEDTVFDDLLAIKYIRNAYVHGEWSKVQRNFAESRGFPGNMMKFNEGHFKRMRATYEPIMNGLGMVMALSYLNK